MVELDEKSLINKDWWRGKRVLVTGMTGVVGYNLTKTLLDVGCVVYGTIFDLDFGNDFFWNEDILARIEKTFTMDLCKYSETQRVVVESKPDIVFHLAAVTQVVDATQMPRYTYLVNVLGTVNLLDAINSRRDTHPIVVVASSDKAYGETDWPADEEAPIRAWHPYDASKACADIAARSYATYYGIPLAVTRCGNIYGPGDVNWQRIVPGAIRSFIEGETFIIRSDGSNYREYNYVDDIVNAYMMIAERLDPFNARPVIQRGDVFNISSPDGFMNVLDMVYAIHRTMGLEGEPDIEILGKAKDETPSVSLVSDKMKEMTGWHPVWSLEEGLWETITWVTEFLTRRNWRNNVPRFIRTSDEAQSKPGGDEWSRATNLDDSGG